jgi:hypothetical protein
MSAEAKRVTKTEVWVGWENQIVNGVYPLRRFLGGSNHSAVFLTQYRPEGVTNAAIKLVPADTLETEAQLVRWGTAATLNHPHLIRLFDVGRCHIGGRVYLYVVMEYADQTLAQLLPRRALSPEETRDMLIPALSALNFLHRNSLVQGQMKPTNLLVVGDQVKLASDAIRSTGKLSSGILRASLHDPPELEDGEISPAGDIWGLGVTLVEALTQHPPSWPDAKSETVSLTASIPPLFVDTVQRCLNRTPANRPSAAELQGQFDPTVHAHPITVVAAEEPVYEVSTVSTASDDAGAARPRSGAAGGVLILGVAAVLGLAVWVSRTIFVSQFESPAGAAVGGAVSGLPGPASGGFDAATVATVGSAAATAPSAAATRPAVSGSGAGADSAARKVVAGSGAGGSEARGSEVEGSGPARSAAVVGSPLSGAAGPSSAPSVAASGTALHSLGGGTAWTSGPGDSGISVVTKSTDLAAQQPEILGSVLHQQLPDIPRTIREKIRGHVNVSVRVLVDPTGNVVGEFFESAGPSRYFARQAGDAATEWKFVPTDGHGPRVWMLKFEFTRAGTTVRAVGTQ